MSITSQLSKKEIPANSFLRYVPSGHSPALYLKLVNHLLGTDRNGNARDVNDLAIFLITASRTGLDPLAKQIYPVYRWDSRVGREVMTVQVGIDGMRAVAERSGLYAGSDDAVFEEENKLPKKATVTVYKLNKETGERMPITASARFEEYVQTGKEGKIIGLWARMPYLMLSKCAEALALRKAFPNDLGGVYTEDELPKTTLEALPKPAENGASQSLKDLTEETLEKVAQKMESDEPAPPTQSSYFAICSDCGNKLYPKADKSKWGAITVHAGTCPHCKQHKTLIPIADWEGHGD